MFSPEICVRHCSVIERTQAHRVVSEGLLNNFVASERKITTFRALNVARIVEYGLRDIYIKNIYKIWCDAERVTELNLAAWLVSYCAHT